MLDRVLLTICILLYAVGVPYLEINATHVFNPHWVAHAKLHEVWQLVTNTAFGIISLCWIWGPSKQRFLPSVVALLITGGFMVAYVTQSLYGGSMVHPDGTEKTLFGVNVGVIGFGLVILISVFTMIRAALHPEAPNAQQGDPAT